MISYDNFSFLPRRLQAINALMLVLFARHFGGSRGLIKIGSEDGEDVASSSQLLHRLEMLTSNEDISIMIVS
jgi:hypothetical protein